ncbi:protocadherin-8-like [Salvelinus sp. IW2-2015]|uniref:protocadherin-8-like n=1 Tax=Salvelinus sp. IW2-2015 TaxID=2691554 RepID=UPI000CDF913C|nr:protocadherin-8-like [Salvelinus alpinus]
MMCGILTGWHGWFFGLQMLFFSLAESEGNPLKYQTNEEGSPGTVIGNLAKDMSLSPSFGSNTNFRMMKQFNDSFIRVRESDGELSVGERIDRERICRHTLQCLITFDVVSFSKERYKLIHVEVEVKDINDNSPEFPNKESTVEISENADVGFCIHLDPAEDADVGSNYIQSYQISVNSHFSIDVLLRADGVKYAELVLMKELDRETQSSYAVELIATDGGNPYRSGSTKITIKVTDFNDNRPVFDQNNFSVTLPENAQVGFVLLDLNAVDPDEGLNGEVGYGFGKQVSAEIRELFEVDSKSGRVRLKNPVDFETKKTYELDVQATDLGSNPTPAVCKIIIHIKDVNDNAPEISITPMTSISTGIAYISETADKDSLVALISTSDRDSGVNSQVHCTLYGHDHFKLQQAYEDSYMIVTAAFLDREKISEYNLTVMAEDFGSPPLRKITQYTIRLSDENDNAPHFTKPIYEVSVVENNAPGAYITTVEARDADLGTNGKITYRLLDSVIMGSPVNTFVSINAISGSIYALRSFNYEVMKHLEVHIQASDEGSPQLQSSAIIILKILDQNDNAPSIIEPILNKGSAEIFLPKDAPAGYVVTQIKATDAEEGINAQMSYKITEGGHFGFSINKVTGKLHVTHELNYDLSETLRVLVAVNDNGTPSLTSTATIHLTLIEGTPPSVPAMVQNDSVEVFEWDIAIIIVLSGSCSLLLLAIILITTTCSRRKQEKREAGYSENEDMPHVEKGESRQIDSLITNHKSNVFDVHPFPEKAPLASSNTIKTAPDDGRQEKECVFDNRIMEGKLEGYSTLPGYRKETLRPITIWKGNSFTTISARDPQFSGKDSGKGDSDFNDSDSDISGDGHKKDSPPINSLWACTSECKILGHSDRCWSPSATRANTSLSHGPHLSTFSKTASLPRNTLQRDAYYQQAHLPKINGLQSVYEKVQHQELDYILVCPPTPARILETDEISLPEYGQS